MAEKNQMTLLEKLFHIQQELNAPKNLRNNFGGYNYRSCESILEAVKPLLLKYRCVLTLADRVVCEGGKNYIEASAKLTDIDSGSDWSCGAFARESESKKGMDDSQLTGATSSYARKYALNGLFAIDDNKDADATNTHGKGDNTEAAPVVDDKRLEELELCFQNCQTNEDYQRLWASLTQAERDNKTVYGYAVKTAQRVQQR